MSSDHKSLYKSVAGDAIATESVERRRRRLLDEQRAQRQHTVDSERQRVHAILDDLLHTDVDHSIADVAPTSESDQHAAAAADTTATRRSIKPPQQHRHHNKSSKKAGERFKNYLQLSEWLHERPDDLADNWTMVACPQGRRCLVIATAGRTSVYGKNGGFVRRFRSTLPGDRGGTHVDLSILDCVQTADDGLWVLDVLAWGRHDFTDCDVAFRFHWLANQCTDVFDANDGDAAAENRVRPALRADCSDGGAVAEMLQRWPLYGPVGRPAVDGLLFYHRESTYVHGSTPLVGWLYPFMVGEVLGQGEDGDCWRSVHPEWLAQRPEDYVNAAAYIGHFDAALKNRRRTKGHARQQRRAMEVDVQQEEEHVNAADGVDEMDAERYLEQTGVGIDDVFYDDM